MESQEDIEFNRGMVVVAHADDAEYGCSGTVAKLCNLGTEMVYVMCTNGSKGTSNRNISQKELSAIRHDEQVRAGKVLGLKEVVFLDYEDSMLEPSIALRRDITQEIRRHKPDILICQYPLRTLDGKWGIGHPDHIAAGEAALSATFPSARDHLTFPELLESGLEPHKVSEVWIMGHPVPNHWVDVTNHMETSVSAILQHHSQIEGSSTEEMDRRMREGRREKGVGKGMQYAEEFRLIRMR